MRKARSAVAVCAALLVLAACAGDDDGDGASAGPSTATADAAAPPFATATVVEDLVDPSRPTVRGDGTEVAPDRTLTTMIWYPEDAGAPVPLVVLAHGFGGHPDKFDDLANAWAAAGYVVAAPAFPLTNRDTPGGTELGDYRSQPTDVSFVIDEVLAASEDADSPLAGLVDAEHIGVAGHSLGGITTLGAAFNSCCRDERLDAVVVFDGAQLEFDGTYDYSSMPILVMHGDADEIVPAGVGATIFERAAPPKYFVTILGGTHSPPFEDDPHPADAAVEELTVDFWDGYLAGDAAALAALLEDGDQPGMTTIEADPGQ